jgi:hypothetical protein
MDIENFSKLLRFAKSYEKSKAAISKQDIRGVYAIQSLENIKNDLKLFINNNFEENKYDVTNSQGAPSLPRVSWVAVTLRRTRVSNCPSYAICFGRKGDGIVHGLMVPAAYSIDGLITVDRTSQELYIDINGTKQVLHYNNKFINPKELYEKEITAEKIINHLKKSLIILEQNQINQ